MIAETRSPMMLRGRRDASLVDRRTRGLVKFTAVPTMPANPIDQDRIALAVQQPWAELIVRGVKTLEIRSSSTRVRGPIYVYASRRMSDHPDAEIAVDRHALDRATLPLGVIVGLVTLVDSRRTVLEDAAAACVMPETLTDRFAWRVADPVRFAGRLAPRFVPYGIWFYPFRRRNGAV